MFFQGPVDPANAESTAGGKPTHRPQNLVCAFSSMRTPSCVPHCAFALSPKQSFFRQSLVPVYRMCISLTDAQISFGNLYGIAAGRKRSGGVMNRLRRHIFCVITQHAHLLYRTFHNLYPSEGTILEEIDFVSPEGKPCIPHPQS